MFSKQYRERYKDALKLQRWPLVDTAKMEKEKKEEDRKARLRRLYGLPDDKLKTLFTYNFVNNTTIYVHEGRYNS